MFCASIVLLLRFAYYRNTLSTPDSAGNHFKGAAVTLTKPKYAISMPIIPLPLYITKSIAFDRIYVLCGFIFGDFSQAKFKPYDPEVGTFMGGQTRTMYLHRSPLCLVAAVIKLTAVTSVILTRSTTTVKVSSGMVDNFALLVHASHRKESGRQQRPIPNYSPYLSMPICMDEKRGMVDHSRGGRTVGPTSIDFTSILSAYIL